MLSPAHFRVAGSQFKISAARSLAVAFRSRHWPSTRQVRWNDEKRSLGTGRSMIGNGQRHDGIRQHSVAAAARGEQQSPGTARAIEVSVDGRTLHLSPILARDMCGCAKCVDQSTLQKFWSSAEIPRDIRAPATTSTPDGIRIAWENDLPGYDDGHVTELSTSFLRSIGLEYEHESIGPRTLCGRRDFEQQPDVEYEQYMADDATLLDVVERLHSHGLVFLSHVPESERSISTITERIGIVKSTFYGPIWDVRSVPQAKNVAYTTQDLGFHTDLMYLDQPPYIQLLHCIRSSSEGGAGLFTDAYRSASDLFDEDPQAFKTLACEDVTFHYNHPSSALYYKRRKSIQLRPLTLGGEKFSPDAVDQLQPRFQRHGPTIVDFIDAISWSPPFQGPFALDRHVAARSQDVAATLSDVVERWHAAAQAFHRRIHRPEMVYERMMRPGECVLFDNRRVLHARRAFAAGDAGKERWLRGAYLDRDVFESKLKVLRRQVR